MAKVLLIQPHDNIDIGKPLEKVSTPINLIYLATAIEDNHKVKIYDRNFSLDDNKFINFVKEFNPDIVGINSITSEMLLDLIHLGKLLKKEFPKKLIVVGGVHATIEPESVLKEPYVDYIIRGEGEAALLEFCDTFDRDKKKLGKLKNVNLNTLRPLVDMDKLKLPNYNHVDFRKYDTFYINLSRGCPGSCTFCYSPKMWGINNNPCIRAYSTEKSIEYFKKLIEEYKIKVFSIVDDNFMPFKKRAFEICDFLKDYDLQFFCFGRADYVNDEILRALKKAGCHSLQIGIESGSQRILDYLNKRVTVEQNIEAIKCCKRNGIRLDASCMIGITTETLEELKKTEWLIKTYKPDLVNLRIFNPMPGTPIFDYCFEKGLVKKPLTLKDWASWTGDMTYIKHNTSNIPDDVLMKKLQELWMVGFYKNKMKRFVYWLKKGEFLYILKNIKKVFNVRGDFIRLPILGYITKRKKKSFSHPTS